MSTNADHADGFTDCDRCGTTEREELTIGGQCKSCYALQSGLGQSVEIPKATLEKLIGMAKSRHPTACNQDAPRLEQVLAEEGLIDEE